MRTKLVPLALIALLAACRQPPPVESGVTTTTAASSAPSSARLLPPSRRPGECDTLFDVEAPDTLRLARADGSAVLYANEQVGVAVVDVSDPDRPAMRGVSELVGTPAGVFEVRGVVLVVYEPDDRPGTTAVRAVTMGAPVRTLGEDMVAGRVRDARRLGDFLVVTRETSDGKTIVSSYGAGERGPVRHGEIVLSGGNAVTGASPRGVAVARAAAPELGADRTTVTWLVLEPDTGALAMRGSATFSGVIPRWRPSRGVIDVTEDDRVRLVTCATAACDASGPAAYAAIDFVAPSEPRVVSWNLVGAAGDGVIGFQGTRLIVARPAADRSDASELAFYRTESALTPVGKVRVRGSVGSIAVRDSGDVVTVGWTGSATSGKHAIVHHVDARETPRLVGAATFGGDWTWSRAYDDDRILGFDPLSTVAALPMTTVRGKLGPTSAVQVLSFERTGPRAVAEEAVGLADRLMFVNGRLLAFSADGVVVLRREGEQGSVERWDQLPRLVQ